MKITQEFGLPVHEFRLVFGRTKIDYDTKKDDINREKHGYSLESAVHLLERLLLPIGNSIPHAVSDSYIEKGEVRHMHMSLDDSGNIVVMVTTMRPDETVRVISFRRASEGERVTFNDLINSQL